MSSLWLLMCGNLPTKRQWKYKYSDRTLWILIKSDPHMLCTIRIYDPAQNWCIRHFQTILRENNLLYNKNVLILSSNCFLIITEIKLRGKNCVAYPSMVGSGPEIWSGRLEKQHPDPGNKGRIRNTCHNTYSDCLYLNQ